MVRKLAEIGEFKVKYKDVFHLKNLYIMMHEYLLIEGWGGPSGIGVDNPGAAETHGTIEKLYLEKFCQKGLHQGGKEMWVWWRVYKRPMSKFSGYFRWRIDLDMHMVYMKDLEIMHKGKKLNVQTGEIEFSIRPYMEADYDSKWEKHWLLKHFQDLYEKRMLSQEIDKMEKELWREAYKFQGLIKKYLNMRVFIPVPELPHPRMYGYGVA